MAQLTSQLVVQLLDRATGPARGIANAIRGIGQSTREANRVPVSFGERIDAAITRNDRALARARGGLVDAVAGYYMLRTAIGAPIKAAMDFEDAMADVRKVVDFPTPEALDDFRGGLMDLSREVPVAVSGLAQIAAAAGQAGIARDDIIAFTEAAAKVGVAFDISADEAGEAMAKLMTGLGLSVDEAVLLSDAMNHLSNNQAASASDILDVVRRVGATATMYGFSAEQTAAFASAMVGAGAESNVAATSFRNMGRALTRGAAATSAQKKAFEALGMSATEVATDMQHDAVATTMLVLEKLGELPAEQQAVIASQLFGEEARALGPLMTNLDLLRQSLGLVGTEADYAGSSFSEFESRNATFSSEVARFNNRLEELKITIGNALLPILSDLLDKIGPVVSKLAEFSEAHPKLIGRILAAVAALVSFRIAIAALRFVGLLGVGGALSLLKLGFAGVSTAATAAATSVEASTARINRSMLGIRLKAGFAAIQMYNLASQMGGTPEEVAARQARNQTRMDSLFRKIPGLSALMSGQEWLQGKVSGEAAPDVANVEGLSDVQAAATRILERAQRDGDLPTADRLDELRNRIASVRDEIAGLESEMADGGGGSAQRMFLEGKKRELAAIEEELRTATLSATELTAALKALSEGEVTPEINTREIDRALSRARELSSTLRSLEGAAGAASPRMPDGARARGGPISPGRAYLVGEEGPELISPRRSGYVHPNGSQGGGAQITVAPVFHFAGVGGGDAAAIEASVRKALHDEVRETFQGIFADTGMRFA